MHDGSDLTGIIVACVIGAIYVIALVYVLEWVKRDAESRGKSGWIVVVLVLFLNLPGLFAWLAFRPEKTIGHRDLR